MFRLSLGASLVVQMVRNLQCRRLGFDHGRGREDPLEKGLATHSNILPGESHGQRSLASYSPWGCKESNMTK